MDTFPFWLSVGNFGLFCILFNYVRILARRGKCKQTMIKSLINCNVADLYELNKRMIDIDQICACLESWIDRHLEPWMTLKNEQVDSLGEFSSEDVERIEMIEGRLEALESIRAPKKR